MNASYRMTSSQKLYKADVPEKRLLIEALYTASTMWSRLKGLLGSVSIGENEALLIKSCNQIHTVGMKFSIDAVFIDGNGVVKKLVANLKPYRFAFSLKAKHVIEMQSGKIQQSALKVGDKLAW